jgi:hypothetical protein
MQSVNALRVQNLQKKDWGAGPPEDFIDKNKELWSHQWRVYREKNKDRINAGQNRRREGKK